MPSAPRNTFERPTAQRPAGRREYEHFDWYESRTMTLSAGTAFQEVITFSGRPATLILDARVNPVQFRLRDRGKAAGVPIRLQDGLNLRISTGAEIVEAASIGGAGGEVVVVTGLYNSREIDVRTAHPGPSRERPMLEAERLATQVATTE